MWKRLHKVLQQEANNLRRVFEWEVSSIMSFKGVRHGITCFVSQRIILVLVYQEI